MMDQHTKAKLRRYIERIENVETERKALTTDIADILKQASGDGFDAKIMRQVLKLRKLTAAQRQEADAILDTYMHAVSEQLEMFEEAA